MIPKSGNRFSEMIMPNKKLDSDPMQSDQSLSHHAPIGEGGDRRHDGKHCERWHRAFLRELNMFSPVAAT